MGTWKEYNVNVDSKDIEIISQLFIDCGSNGVSIVDRNDGLPHPQMDEIWAVSLDSYPKTGAIIKAYLPYDELLNEIEHKLQENIQDLYAAHLINENYPITSKFVYEEDWLYVWEKYYKAIELTKHLKIIPIWKKESVREDSSKKKLIYLDPGLAFGTGDHPTTQLCAQAIDKYIQLDDVVYDVGTGSGILAIVSAKLGAKKIGAYDFDHQAVRSAQHNASLNNVESVIEFSQKDLLNGVNEPADLIIANILEPVIIRLIPAVPKLLNKNGKFIISGILDSQISNVEKHLAMANLRIKEITKKEDWIAIIAILKNKEES